MPRARLTPTGLHPIPQQPTDTRARHHDPKRAWRSTARWKRIRGAKLANTPWCENPACGATHDLTVDHIRPVHAGGDPWAWENLQTLCRSCNSSKGGKVDPDPGTAPLAASFRTETP